MALLQLLQLICTNFSFVNKKFWYLDSLSYVYDVSSCVDGKDRLAIGMSLFNWVDLIVIELLSYIIKLSADGNNRLKGAFLIPNGDGVREDVEAGAGTTRDENTDSQGRHAADSWLKKKKKIN